MKKQRKSAAGSKKKNSTQATNSNLNQSSNTDELICNQLNNAGQLTIFSEPAMDTLNTMNHLGSINNGIYESNDDKADDDRPTLGRPVIMGSILKSALAGTYSHRESVRQQDENMMLADTTVADESVAVESALDPNDANNKIAKETIDELIKQLIQVDDYSNCGRFLRSKASAPGCVSKSTDQNRKLIQYVQKDNNESNQEQQLVSTNEDKRSLRNESSLEDEINDLIHDGEHELNNSTNDLNEDDEDEKDDEMLAIIVDKQLSLNEKLCSIGDSIVFNLVQWTKKLPFYSKLPVYSITMVIRVLNNLIAFN